MAVQFRVLQNVLVDEVAEDFACLLLFTAEDGRPGKADDGGSGECLASFCLETAEMRMGHGFPPRDSGEFYANLT